MKPLFEVNQKIVWVGGLNLNYKKGTPALIEGEIYRVSRHCAIYYPGYVEVFEHLGYCYQQILFRPVDETFGEAVTETIEEQIEYYEKVAL